MKPMKLNEYRAAIETIGLSQVAAGRFLGVDARTSRRWALGEAPIPNVVAILLRYMVRRKIAPSDVNPEFDT